MRAYDDGGRIYVYRRVPIIKKKACNTSKMGLYDRRRAPPIGGRVYMLLKSF